MRSHAVLLQLGQIATDKWSGGKLESQAHVYQWGWMKFSGAKHEINRSNQTESRSDNFDFIRELRQRRKTWREIADLLCSEKGIRVTFYAPYRFYRRKLKRAAKPNWENSAGEIQPINTAIQPPSRPAPLPKQSTFNRPNIKKINTDQEFT